MLMDWFGPMVILISALLSVARRLWFLFNSVSRTAMHLHITEHECLFLVDTEVHVLRCSNSGSMFVPIKSGMDYTPVVVGSILTGRSIATLWLFQKATKLSLISFIILITVWPVNMHPSEYVVFLIHSTAPTTLLMDLTLMHAAQLIFFNTDVPKIGCFRKWQQLLDTSTDSNLPKEVKLQ